MEGFAGQLARLRAHVAAQRALPLDLGRWAIDELSRVAGSAELRARRNLHLCRAGAIVGGTVRQRAQGILKEAAAVERVIRARGSWTHPGNQLRAEVHAACLIAPIPAERQLRTILAAGATEVPGLAIQGVSTSNVHVEHASHEQSRERHT